MTIDLRSVIGSDSAIKSGGFTGAVFLTYTLNLTFYEQMLAPMLDQAGCANVLILVDPDGYQEALEMGLRTISGAGLRYVCSPLIRPGGGVQHAKMLFMAGPKRGRLLVGSGNLTLHGFGRNLELFSYFEYDVDQGVGEQLYPFIQTWRLIEKLSATHDLPQAGRNQIQNLRETASWLNTSALEPLDFRVWYNHDEPILDQLIAWRTEHGLAGQPIQDICVISPYFDQDGGALQKLVDQLLPEDVHIHLDPGLTNLDGQQAAKSWSKLETNIRISGIGPGSETSQKRHVHAKAIIGKETNGAWFLTGSANLTRPALLRTWMNGGNLELVTFRWANGPAAFDYLLSDPTVQVWPLSLDHVSVTELQPSERTTHLEANYILTDLSARGDYLEGCLSSQPPEHNQSLKVHLLRKNIKMPIHLNDDFSFRVQLPAPLEGAEAARLETDSLVTPYRWIDQPEILARFGARTYQIRVKGKIETILGAEKLFQELMNYLWERVEPDDTGEQDPRALRRSRRRQQGSGQGTSDGPSPLGPEGFIIEEEELVRTLHWAVEQQQPYDRHLLSLRNLLSLALLRLTTTTQVGSTSPDGESRDEDADQKYHVEQEAQQVKVLESLRNYLIGYCKRYGRRLVESIFIHNKQPRVIFQNHFTLSRVLLEFAARAESVFTHQDLTLCFWWIWAPLAWPEIIGLPGRSTLQLFKGECTQAQIQDAWRDVGMAEIALIMLDEALGQPPTWKFGLWDKARTSLFLVAHEWINRIKRMVGNDAFRLEPQRLNDALGIRSIAEIIEAPQAVDADYYLESFTRLEQYLPPIQEKYRPLICLSELRKAGSSVPRELIDQTHQQGLSSEYEAYQHRPVPIMATHEGDPYCPRCGAQLTIIGQNGLRQGKLVLCTSSGDAWIYLKPKMPTSVL